MAERLRIAMAQINLTVGNVADNTQRVIDVIGQARERHRADLVLFPELALCGYPPEDLLLHGGLRRQVADSLSAVRNACAGIAALVGYPEYTDTALYNSAALFADRKLQANHRKQHLPNYLVFDEQRYFEAGTEPTVADVAGVPIGLTVCEDVWESEPCALAARSGARLIVSINGSPFRLGKQLLRENVLADRARETGLPIAYQNLVGGQDELVFDGGSCIVGADGAVTARGPAFDEAIVIGDFSVAGERITPVAAPLAPLGGDEESIYTALVTGVRDYVHKNGFPGVVLGLSGGIDSALTLSIAVDALGADAVQALMMPYHYTSSMSLEDAQAQAELLGADYQVIPIEGIVTATGEALRELFAGLPADVTEENIQSRCRGLLLMAVSNKTGRMVLATGNKSEMAVGYATLYGDMAGGFAPIKDCTKSLVYRLARYRNSRGPAIPARVIERAPTAELAPDQLDSDSLPAYELLDPILDALMLENCSVDEIVARGFDRQTVGKVLSMVRRNEYKRRQAAPGVRISGRAFGRDWRYPITSGYQHR